MKKEIQRFLNKMLVFVIFAVISCIFVRDALAVYGVPIINVKHAEKLEREGKFKQATQERELAAEFCKFMSIPQFQDDLEFFLSIGDEDKAKFCQNTIAGFQKTVEESSKKAAENLIEANLTREEIEKFRKRNRMRLIASAELYPVMHNGQMGIDINALEKHGKFASDFEKAAEGRERSARLYENMTVKYVLHLAEVVEKEGKPDLAAEYREKANVYKEKAAKNYKKAEENRQKAEKLRKFDDREYVLSALDDDSPKIRALAVDKLTLDADYLGLLKASKSDFAGLRQMAENAIEANEKLFNAKAPGMLVAALKSDDATMREIAIEQLEKFANTTLGYDAHADQSQRNIAAERWQGWIQAKLKPGLWGTYYKGKNFDKEIASRVDEQIDFQWSKEPHEDLPKDKFSIRWIGKIKIPQTGKYVFSVKNDDGVKVSIGRDSEGNIQRIIYQWTEYTYSSGKGELHLEKGLHDIEIEYYENSKNAIIKLFWDGKDIRKGIVPKENLFHIGL